MTESFIELLTNKVNKYYTCYYEEVPKNAIFPYIVIPKINIIPLEESGYMSLVDMYIYNNELSNILTEKICDDIRDNLENYSVMSFEKKIGFHLGFDSQDLENSNEQDLIFRKLSFSARIFKYKEGK